MTDREKFFDTVGILVEAYLNETLMHGECCACAVGNILAAKLNCKVQSRIDFLGEWHTYWQRGDDEVRPLWPLVFTSKTDGSQFQNPKSYMGSTKSQIDRSGYTWQELAIIESAFERAAHYDSEGKLLNDPEEAMFNGLMNVVEQLASIHLIDLSTRESAKLLFVKQ
jgi:hypothetical protein